MKYAIADITKAVILGRQGENEVTTIKFPIAEWLHDFDTTGTFMLLNVRPTENDELAYPCVVSNNDEFVYWVVKATDLVYKGLGKCELIYTVNDQIAKSVVYSTNVLESIENSGEIPPEPYQDWVNDVLEKCDEAIAGSARKINDVVDANGNSVVDNEKVAHLPKIGQVIEIYDSENNRLAFTIYEIKAMYENSVMLTFLHNPILRLYSIIEQGIEHNYIFYTMFEQPRRDEYSDVIFYKDLSTIDYHTSGYTYGHIMTIDERLKLQQINISDIVKNTNNRHTHNNKEILDKFSEINGVLNYNTVELVTKTVTDLVNYYSKTEINSLISEIPKFDIKVVESLPTKDISTTTIYLVSNSGTGTELYDEYIYIDNNWEKLGSQTVDLTDYATKDWVLNKSYLTDVLDEYGASLVTNGVARIPSIPELGQGIKIVASDGTLNYSVSEIYRLFNEGKDLRYRTGTPIVRIELTATFPQNLKIYYFQANNYWPYDTALYYAEFDSTGAAVSWDNIIGRFTEQIYTTEEQQKLVSIESYAEVNKIIDVQDDMGNSLVHDKVATIPQTSLTDEQIISVCSTFVDFITDESNNILGVNNNTALIF